jgi:uncharacterized membrane protein YbhN (UPF0104 family)
MSTTDTPPARPVDFRAQIARRVIGAALLSAAIGSLLLAFPGLSGVGRQIAHLRAAFVLAAVALELGSCAAFVVIFRLFFGELPSGAARELAWAEQGAGALLPGGGAGALALGGWLMRREGLSEGRLVERSSALFFLTSAVNVAVLIGASALLGTGAIAGPHDPLRTAIPIAGGLAATGAVLLAPIFVRRPGRCGPARLLTDVAAGIDGARRALLPPSWRLLGAIGYLALDMTALWMIFAATGHPLPTAPLVLGYLLGYLANLIPIPGGFGVLEGGLAGMLIAYGAPATQATAAVIVYHAIAFWIPSAGGLIAYALLRVRLRRPTSVAAPRRCAQPPLLVPGPAYEQGRVDRHVRAGFVGAGA